MAPDVSDLTVLHRRGTDHSQSPVNHNTLLRKRALFREARGRRQAESLGEIVSSAISQTLISTCSAVALDCCGAHRRVSVLHQYATALGDLLRLPVHLPTLMYGQYSPLVSKFCLLIF